MDKRQRSLSVFVRRQPKRFRPQMPRRPHSNRRMEFSVWTTLESKGLRFLDLLYKPVKTLIVQRPMKTYKDLAFGEICRDRTIIPR
jgi:hypothetical protein